MEIIEKSLNPFVSQVGFFKKAVTRIIYSSGGLNPFVSQVGFFVGKRWSNVFLISARSQSLRKSGRFLQHYRSSLIKKIIRVSIPS